MKHIFEIKDFIATKESAERIMSSQIDVILTASDDLNIGGVNVFVNSTDTKFYDKKYDDKYNVKFISTLNSGKKSGKKGGKQMAKQTFAAFHNSVINSIATDLASNDTIVHIQDGTLDLTNLPSERGIYKTRLGEMVVDVVYLMKLLDHPVWFNTASDKGNIKFGHYYTLVDFLNIDETHQFESIPNCIMYSGNSNLDWIMIDTDEYRNKKMPTLMMNGTYFYDFLSVKQLIAKFANYGNGYFDNMFPTVPMEVGSYFRNKNFDKDFQQYDMSKYSENLENYKKNLQEYKNLKPTNINDVVVFLREKLLSKLPEKDKNTLKNFEMSISNQIG